MIAAMVVGPKEVSYPCKIEDITIEHLLFAQEFLTSTTFRSKF